MTRLPRPSTKFVERRRSRSACTATALELALTSSAKRCRLDALLLVDDSGMLVSKGDTELDLTMLAAVTPIIGRGKALPRIRKDGEKRELSVEPLEIEGGLLYLAALGGERFSRKSAVRRSKAATERIFAA